MGVVSVFAKHANSVVTFTCIKANGWLLYLLYFCIYSRGFTLFECWYSIKMLSYHGRYTSRLLEFLGLVHAVCDNLESLIKRFFEISFGILKGYQRNLVKYCHSFQGHSGFLRIVGNSLSFLYLYLFYHCLLTAVEINQVSTSFTFTYSILEEVFLVFSRKCYLIWWVELTIVKWLQ